MPGFRKYPDNPLDAEALLGAVRIRIERCHQTTDAARAGVQTDFTSCEPLQKLGLTLRESKVLLWVAQGKASADVATIPGMSEKSVKVHLGHISTKN